MCQMIPAWHSTNRWHIQRTPNKRVCLYRQNAMKTAKKLQLHGWLYPQLTQIWPWVWGLKFTNFFPNFSRNSQGSFVTLVYPNASQLQWWSSDPAFQAKIQGHFCRERLFQLVPGDGTMGLHAQRYPVEWGRSPLGFLIYVHFSMLMGVGRRFSCI